MVAPKVRVLTNPHAGAGKARRRIPEVRSALAHAGVSFDIVETLAPGDATRLAREARLDGVEILAVMGGDGTFNEVAHAYVDEQGQALQGPDLAVIPSGTGGDYRKSYHFSNELEDALERIRHGEPRAADLGALELVDFDGRPSHRAFINITSFGVGGIADRLVNESPKWMPGKVAFYLGTTRAMFQYRNAPVRIRVDGHSFVEGPIFNVAIAIGRFFGGGMMIAPHADVSDGLFDVISVGNLSRGEALSLTGKIYKGEHLGHRGITEARGALVEAEPLEPREHVFIDMDGETPGRLPLRARILPKAIRVRV